MSQWQPRDIPAQAGKLVIITGANSGIGFHAARYLAKAGAHVMLAVRNMDKGEDAKTRVLAYAPGAAVETAQLDLADLDSVRRFADDFVKQGRALDVLINNAGVMGMPQRMSTKQGFEMQFGTNHLGHFALTGLLLPALLDREGSRIVTVASIAHKQGQLRFDDLNAEQSYDPRAAYTQSKLANLVFGLELERRLEAHHAKTASIIAHPGVAATSIVSNSMDTSLKARIVNAVLPFLAQTDDRGSWPTLYAATSPEAKGGHYYGPNGFKEIKGSPVEVQPMPHARDEATARRLWEESEKLTGVRYEALQGAPRS